MSREIDSGALTLLNRLLGVQGTAGLSSSTELEDDRLIQTIDVGNIVRRSSAIVGTTGIFRCNLEVIGAGAGTVSASIDPYAPGAVAAQGPYPATVPAGLDFWILGASVNHISGAGVLDGAALFVDVPEAHIGWGRDSGGGAVFDHEPMPLALWDSSTTIVAGFEMAITEAGEPHVPIGYRVRRGATLQFSTDTSGAARNDLCQMLCALLPISTGQDVRV